MESVSTLGTNSALLAITSALGEKEAKTPAETTKPTPESAIVDLSPLARALSAGAAGEANRDDDIDNANLPDGVKTLLKQIRRLEAQLRKLQLELTATQSDATLSPEQKEAHLRQLQSELNTTSGALTTANSALQKLMHQQTLSQGQSSTLAALLVKR